MPFADTGVVSAKIIALFLEGTWRGDSGERCGGCYGASLEQMGGWDAAAASLPVRAGDVLAGKYRVDRILGVGGMGVVVAATHLQLGQMVALKFMLPDALQQPTFVERFAREARSAAGLRSDHVARVIDVGTLDSGSPYIVMEYLEGSDLGSVLETRGPLPIETAVDCVVQACDAVAEAHSLGIVHRDLKPRNLFLTHRNDGRALVKVLDFGIAKHRGAEGDLSLTKTTDVMGSPNYMSPEQLRESRTVDERSDIWALGVILYELLAGVLPFAADSVTQLIAMVLTDAPRPIHVFRRDVPVELSRVIGRCLEKEPAGRFGSIAELARALEPFAPVDSRELARRIRRIAASSRRSAPPAASTASLRAPGATTANGWAKTQAARSSRAKVLAFAAGALGLVGVVGAIRMTRSSREPSVAPALVASSVMAATATATATATVAAAMPMATGPPAATATASATSTGTPPRTAPEGLDGGTPRISRSRRDLAAPPARTPADQPPSYRTPW